MLAINQICHAFVLGYFLCCFEVQLIAASASWRAVKPVLVDLMAKHPILVDLYHFRHELDFYKSFPSQQIISAPLKRFKTCPHLRILVLSSQSASQFYLWKRTFRLCPLGTVYFLLGDVQLYAYNHFTLRPYTAQNDPTRKGLFYITSPELRNWRRVRKLKVPSTWDKEYLKQEASIVDVRSFGVSVYPTFEIVFRVGNYNLVTQYIEFNLHTHYRRFYYLNDALNIGTLSPIVAAVYRPQVAALIGDKYLTENATFVTIAVFGLVIAQFARYSSHRKCLLPQAVFFVMACALTTVSLKNLKSHIRLLVTLGLWLFLSQILLSMLKGEMIKNMNFGPRDKIESVNSCERDQITSRPSLDSDLERNRASKRLLSYGHVCLFGALDANLFFVYFRRRFPKAELYPIKSQIVLNMHLQENFDLGVDGWLRPRFLLLRVRVCPVRGFFYFQKLIERGILFGTRVKHFRSFRRSFNNWYNRLDLFFDPQSAYDRHLKRLDSVGNSTSYTSAANYRSWCAIASFGWLLSTVVFFCELAFGYRRRLAHICRKACVQVRWFRSLVLAFVQRRLRKDKRMRKLRKMFRQHDPRVRIVRN